MNKYGVCTQDGDLTEFNKKEYVLLQEAGQFLATLKFRKWGKRMNLGCYFETDDGYKFYLYAWYKSEQTYCPRDCWMNFSIEEDGTRWLIETKINGKGNVFWSTAEKR